MESTQKRSLLLNKRVLIGIVVGLGLLAAISGTIVYAADRSKDNETGGEIENIAPGAINVTDQQARDIVQAAYPNATIQSVDLDGEGDIVYDVALDSGEEIMVSARSGAILGAETDDADEPGSDDD